MRTIHRSQIRAFLAGTTFTVIYVESCVHEAASYVNRKSFGNIRLLEAWKLNMKPWNNCILFIFSMEIILGFQLTGCWPIFISEAIKRKFSLYEPYCVEGGAKKKPNNNNNNKNILLKHQKLCTNLMFKWKEWLPGHTLKDSVSLFSSHYKCKQL